jgi:hypothetical protein
MSERYTELRAALIEQPVPLPPVLEPDPVAHDTVSLDDLVAAEALHVHEAPPTVGGGEAAMLSAKDVRLGRAASRRGSADEPGAVLVRAGDVVVVMGVEPAAHVCAEDGVLLGPGIALVRGSATTIDPHFLAGVLRDAIADGPVDLYRVRIPRVPLADQRRLGAAFRQLAELETAWRLRRATIEQVVRAGVRGLAAGVLRPATVDE